MFYLNFDVAEHIRKNLYIFIVIRENLINDSPSDFTCHVNLQNKDSEPYQVYIDYTIRYGVINDDDYVENEYIRNYFKMKYTDFMELFDKKSFNFTQELMKKKLRTELLDYIYRHKISRETKLYEIPKELLDPETNVLVAVDAFNQKVENLYKHLEQLFESDHPSDLTRFNTVDLNTLETISSDGHGLNLYLYLGNVYLKDKKLEYECDLPNEPYPEFISTFDEMFNNSQVGWLDDYPEVSVL